MNGITTIYTTTCPIGTTTAETPSTKLVTSESSKGDKPGAQTSAASQTTEVRTSTIEETSVVESGKNKPSESQTSVASPATTLLISDTIFTSSVSAETSDDQEQNTYTSTKQTVSQSGAAVTPSSSSEGGVKSVYEGGAVKLLASPLIAVFLALL
ncbi:unnamed protein product [Kluyveromyces dobzhanskii CBS 2104]|uniref:WGS project CCBQ000000000 data, contig 00101 n=1 Tax=Kluyveromyces dobzhanskii CBS 2104 TaxID=1427455 RepID=A0A0A8LDX8_9SACH|nr:unnamed protein product [Kluyveromyces dobzhanskii CBS 2104]